MFEAFEDRANQRSVRRRLSAGGLALLVYGGLAGLVVVAGGKSTAPGLEIETELRYAPPPPPPPPPPSLAAPPPAPTPAAPPPARRAVVAPRQLPHAPPPEAEPAANDTPIAVEPPPPVEAVAAAPATAPSPALFATAPPPEPTRKARPAAHAPMQITEGVTAPEAATDNAQPAYPEEARAAGREGLVVLKFVVTERGTVEQIQVLKGEPPFIDAAVAAVRGWRYTRPAMLDGAPVPVFRVVPLRFKLR